MDNGETSSLKTISEFVSRIKRVEWHSIVGLVLIILLICLTMMLDTEVIKENL